MPPVLRSPRPLIFAAIGLPLLGGPLLARPVAAQEPQPAQVRPAETKGSPMISFEKALAAARLARPIVVLALAQDYEQIAEPKDESVEKVVALFHKLPHQFGWVLAVGPEKVTRLETDLGEPNIYADMPPHEACTLLMEKLDDGQRSKLMSSTGLGLSDLSDPAQKHLFQAMLPHDKVGYWQHAAPGEDQKWNSLDISAEKLAGARLQVGQEIQMFTQATQGYYMTVEQFKTGNGPARYELNSWDAYNNRDVVNGARIRSEVENLPKRGNLNLDAAMFRPEIPLSDLKTVGDLVARIAKQSGVELYADAHYEKRNLILRTGRMTAPMSDLLHALAFCVGGTYRKVGPAFVLVNDLVGVGTQRQIINDFQELGEAMRHPLVHSAEKALQDNAKMQKANLPLFDDTLKPSADQEKISSHETDFWSGLGSVNLPFNQLNEDQKAAINAQIQAQEAMAKKYSGYEGQIPDLTKNIALVRQPVVQLIVPGVDGPLRTDIGGSMTGVFKRDTNQREPDEEQLKKMLLTVDGPKLWAEKSKTYGRRSLLVHPKSKEEVDTTLRRVQEFGLNQLWMVVFEDGKALIPNTPFPILPALKDQPDLFQYALEAAKKANVTVCPVVELLAWGSDTPQDIRDHNLRGEDTEQYEARHYVVRKLKIDNPKNPIPPPKRTVWVDPLDERVQKRLRDLVRVIATYPDVGEIVWNSEMPRGYADDGQYWNSAADTLGYNETLRLAFLREKHLDPIDVKNSENYNGDNRANLQLPQYDSYEDDHALIQRWRALCEEKLRESLRALYAEAVATLPENKRPKVLLMQGNKAQYQIWYDQWADPETPMPKFNGNFYNPAPAATPASDKGKGEPPPKKPISVIRLLLPTHFGPVTIDRKDWPAILGLQLQYLPGNNAKPWDGFVLEEDDFLVEQ